MFRGENNGYFRLCRKDAEPGLLVLGDSYAQILGETLVHNGNSNVSIYSRGGCGFAFNLCNLNLNDFIQQTRPSTLLLSSQWAGQIFPTVNVFPFEDLDSCGNRDKYGTECFLHEQQLRTSISELAAQISHYRSKGVAKIVIIGQSPEFPFSPKSCLRQSFLKGVFFPKESMRFCKQNFFDFNSLRSGHINQSLELFSKTVPDLVFVDPQKFLCTEKSCSVWSQANDLRYVDSIHMSQAGSQEFYSKLENESALPDILSKLGT
jgi:hypothetical protein